MEIDETEPPAATNFIEPMKALRVRELPVGNRLYEPKFDGYRTLAFKSGKEVRLLSRNRTNFNDNYPQLIDALKVITVKSMVIDRRNRCTGSEREDVVPTLAIVRRREANPVGILRLRPAQYRGN